MRVIQEVLLCEFVSLIFLCAPDICELIDWLSFCLGSLVIVSPRLWTRHCISDRFFYLLIQQRPILLRVWEKKSSHRCRLFYVYIRPLEIILKPHQLNWKHVFSRNSWIINGLILFPTDGFRASSKIPPTIREARPFLARSPIRCWTNNDGS